MPQLLLFSATIMSPGKLISVTFALLVFRAVYNFSTVLRQEQQGQGQQYQEIRLGSFYSYDISPSVRSTIEADILAQKERLSRLSSSSSLSEERLDDNNIANNKKNVTAVPVRIYIESLCIDSKRFIMDQLYPMYQALGPNFAGLMDLNEMVVFGNARILPSPDDQSNGGTIECQHGDGECDANSYEQCAISIYPYPYRYLNYLYCLFDVLPMGRRQDPYDSELFRKCALASVLDPASIQTCRDDVNGMAWELQKTAASKTPQQHDHVPWVVITIKEEDDDTKIYDDSDNTQGHLFNFICDAYTKRNNGLVHRACTKNIGSSNLLFAS